MQGTCVRMNDGIDLTVYSQNEMRILGEDIDGTLAMPNRPLSGRIIMAYGACQGTGRRYFAAVRPSPTSSVGRRNYRAGAASNRAVEGRNDQDRKRNVWGKSVSVGVDIGGRRIMKK